MNTENFNAVVDNVTRNITNTLNRKADEYANEAVTTDRLHNFKRAAILQKTTPIKALIGMKTKHTVSIEDLIERIEKAASVDHTSILDTIDEKFGDEINYLILLKALLIEQVEALPSVKQLVNKG